MAMLNLLSMYTYTNDFPVKHKTSTNVFVINFVNNSVNNPLPFRRNVMKVNTVLRRLIDNVTLELELNELNDDDITTME